MSVERAGPGAGRNATIFVVGAIVGLVIGVFVGRGTVDEEVVRDPLDPVADVFADVPETSVEWQNTVVDIEPTSRFTGGTPTPDTGHVVHTIALTEPPTAELRRALEAIEGVHVSYVGDTVVRLFHRVEVPHLEIDAEGENPRYGLEMVQPLPFAQLQKNGDFSLVVMLPRSTSEYGAAPTYTVELVQAASGSQQEVLEAEEAQRTIIRWYERQDPSHRTIYEYVGSLPP